MKTGILLLGLTSADTVHLAQAAERKGLQGVWIPEQTGRDSVSLLGAISNATKRVKIASCILNVYSRTPAVLAMTIATLDELSGGRMIAGLGVGNDGYVRDVHGMAFEEPLLRLKGTVEIVQKALSGRSVTHDGGALRVKNWKLGMPAPPRAPPIFIGAHNKTTLEYVGEACDGAIMNVASTEDIVRARKHIELGMKKAGRKSDSVKLASIMFTTISDDDEKAMSASRRRMAFYLSRSWILHRLRESKYASQVPAITRALEAGGVEKVEEVISDEMVREMAIVGKPKTLRRRLKEYEEAGLDIALVYATPTPGRERRSISDVIQLI